MELHKDFSLKRYNTFGIEVRAQFFTGINSVDAFRELQQEKVYSANQRLILGGGSNILFTQNFAGLVIKNNMQGIEIISENASEVIVKVNAGENWHHFVSWCVERNYGGLENLSLIPGCVGAAPMQNIGAYGVEIKDTCREVFVVDVENGKESVFSNKDCEFGYRESIFKRAAKNKFLISAVSFTLSKKPTFNTSYGAIEQELDAMGVKELSIKAISEAVIHIRSSKLPDPAKTGNAGSFFKNPEVSREKHDALKAEFPMLVSYPLGGGKFKLAAGWLIEQCGLKGLRRGHAGVHDSQALVLVNLGGAAGREIYDLSQEVLEAVQKKFGIILEREVNIY